MASLPQFSESNLEKLDVSANKEPNSEPVVETFDDLRAGLVTVLQDTEWGQRYIWEGEFQTPYIGPNRPNESAYVWLGLVDEYYTNLPRASNGLQMEFGVDAASTTGFLNQDVIWGILLGPWANEKIVDNVTESLQTHSSFIAQFLKERDEYVLLTKNHSLDTPNEAQIKNLSDDIGDGFAVTRKIKLMDLPDINVLQLATETISKLTPLYRLLAGIKNAPYVSSLSHSTESILQDAATSSSEWDIASLAQATTLDAEDIEDAVNRLVDANHSHEEAIGYVRRYLKQMLEGDGLFAVYGVGPSSGSTLVDAGITTIEELRAVTPQDLSNRADLSTEQVQRFQEAAQAGNFSSLEPGDEQVAKELVDSANDLPTQNTEIEHSPDTKKRTDRDADQPKDSTVDATRQVQDNSKEAMAPSKDNQQEVLTPSELPTPAPEEYTVPGNGTVYPNYLSEYYESFRNARKVLELVFKIPGTDINPENRRDPRVQYFVLLDACIGFGDVSTPFTGYGPQHQNRLSFSINDYRQVFGDAETVTEYQVIDVKPFKDDTHELLQETASVKATREFVRPCVPGTNYPIPELPGSFEELQDALLQLTTFPAYPPLPSENGIDKKTIPIADIYRTCFAELSKEYQVNLTPLEAHKSQPTGPVPASTPTSSTEAESKLIDYGRLSHLYKRATPPAGSPVNRALNIFALDWYRPDSQSFNALQGLAKYGEDGHIDIFRQRLRDLIHRRFLLDSWEYDYITVYPGHEAGSRNSQLVELAQDAVLETDIIYTPLLERTETVKRQREKSEEERQQVAFHPSKSLRTRAKLHNDAVILFDDICTTGSSLLAGAHLLRQAGADRVVCITLGLTPGGPRTDVKEVTDSEASASEIIAGVE
jgi:predicted flap endonuclease-1-like 5' DNA nuclease